MTTKKSFFTGFLIGFVGVYFSILGLAIGFIEVIGKPFLAPTKLVLKPLNGIFPATPGFLNIFVFALVSGFIYGFLFLLITKLFRNKKISTER